ncbi:U3 small nucleolar RNA-associated protein 17 [Pleurostoma richardsiae]|uniref:U3 small nucleolar RNA-associated protein 17 n=1 Tax=Pleurostoma richardsiae TaxID=41990 RepID=A0AA38R1S0_9PEZI|nr:U3 small nucleolar RNA-associated protein 17 [Pleurostoma richardsiae]
MPSTPKTKESVERPEKRKREKADLGETSHKKKRRERKSVEQSANSASLAVDTQELTKYGSEGQINGTGTEGISSPPPWKVLEPMGGRMSNIDPIFSEDGKYIIITYNTSIQVYSTDESLLVRRIPLVVVGASEESGPSRPYIVESAVSRVSPHVVWVASSDGRVWCVDWTTGAVTETSLHNGPKTVLSLAVAAVRIAKDTRDVLFVTEKTKSSSRIVAYDVHAWPKVKAKELQVIEGQFSLVKTVNDGSVLVGASRNTILIGALKLGELKSISDLTYRFASFEISDEVASLDIRLARQQRKGSKGKEQVYTGSEVDVAVGGARGAVLVYSDVLASLPSKDASGSGRSPVRSRKYHWHQRAVHAVAWSRDGNYLISGGSETVLVHYQLDTGKFDFLPHLSASIENIVVSPSGSSYAVHLDDNSAMILSTAEMKPTAYVSGVQSLVFSDTASKDQMIRRVWQGIEEINIPVAAAISPAVPSRLLLSVGEGQQASLSGHVPALPLVQSFDLEAFQNIAKQPLARTNATNNIYTTKGHLITEPTVTRLAFSKDGNWLATVDEWEPPQRDIASIADAPKFAAEFSHERREVHLKFWNVSENSNTLDLASRIIGPHFTYKCEEVFGLAADKASNRFATVGDDGTVRIWARRIRTQDGHVSTDAAGQPVTTWSCTRTISLGESLKAQDELVPSESRADHARSGAVTFSDDGSLLFVAFGANSEAVVYIIDATSGDIRFILHDLFRGPVRDMQLLSSCLVLLSHDLTVYDLVADELRYGLQLDKVTAATAKMTHLAVDPNSHSFAVSVPVLKWSNGKLQKGAMSEIAVFTPDDSQPLLIKTIPHLVTSLLATVNSPGFIAIDSAAQIWPIVEGANSTHLAQPLADLKLDTVATDEKAVVLNGADEEGSEDEQEDAMDVEEADEDYDIHAAVVAPQRLTEIFDAAPAFAMPPIEDIFYRVAGLLSPKPVAAPSA